MPRERELQRGYVPAARAEDERAAAEWSLAAVVTERGPGLRAWYAVRRKTGLALEAANRVRRPGPQNAVNRADVEAAGTEPDLQRGNLGVAGGCGRPDENNSGECRRQGCENSAHGPKIGAKG